MGGGAPWKGLEPSRVAAIWPGLPPADPVSALVPAGVGLLQICFRFQFPLLLKPPQGRKKQTVILS